MSRLLVEQCVYYNKVTLKIYLHILKYTNCYVEDVLPNCELWLSLWVRL